jgi:hypothetical protein
MWYRFHICLLGSYLSGIDIGISDFIVSSIYNHIMAELKIDRSVITLSHLGDRSDDEYWQSKSPMERIAAIQTNRQAAYGESDASARLQRILEITQQTRS